MARESLCGPEGEEEEGGGQHLDDDSPFVVLEIGVDAPRDATSICRLLLLLLLLYT